MAIALYGYTIEKAESLGVAIIPTVAQLLQCFILCQRLTMMYRPIYLVRLDERTSEVVIIAGEETQIAIEPDGKWTYKA
ncbi:hypothetical protein [Microseira sp. BLCC-F43]|uniref:DUF6888 family protein n=1 Tax=Microseira sp. BLCC-F43 TaxID=3153602 RepID=UPI0035B8B4FE